MASIELPALFVDGVAAVIADERPVLVNRDPGPAESAVPIDTGVTLELVDPGPDGIDRAATRVWVDGTLAFDGGTSPEIQPRFSGGGARVTETPDTLRIHLQPTTFFQSEAVVSVRVVSATNTSAHTLDTTYHFNIEDRTAPRIVGGQATGQRTVRLGFDEPVRVTDLKGFELRPADFPAVPLEVISAKAEGSVVLLRLDTEMTPRARYEVVVSGIADVEGNPVLAPFDRAIVSGYEPARPLKRRFDLWSMLPQHNRRGDQTGDLFLFIACLQEVTDLLLTEVDRFPDIFDLERAPEPFLDLILRDLGNPFAFELDALSKRRLAAVLVEMYRQKGTAIGIENAIRFFLDIDVDAITSFGGTTLVLGESELGVGWELGALDTFSHYAFDVLVGQVLTDTERRQIRAIVEYLKPAHTHFVDLVEPLPPVDFGHWVIGESELGSNTLLH